MSDKLVAVGAEWCGFSKRQQEAINGMAEGTASNVHMVMCQDANRNPITHEGDDAWKNSVCEGTKDAIRGFPTWFKQDEDGNVTQLQDGDRGLHFMQTDDICTRLESAGSPCQ